MPPEEFVVFSQLRELQKELAQSETVPVYTLFTNEQLAQMVQRRYGTRNNLTEFEGIGESRLDEYAHQFLPKMHRAANIFDQIPEPENLRLAFHKAARERRGHALVCASPQGPSIPPGDLRFSFCLWMRMADSSKIFRMTTSSYLDRFLAPVTDALTPETAHLFANLRADEEVQAHVDDLARKANDGTITPEEDAEYKAIIDAADLIAILQIKARRFLKHHTP